MAPSGEICRIRGAVARVGDEQRAIGCGGDAERVGERGRGAVAGDGDDLGLPSWLERRRGDARPCASAR